jgi:UDP-N-acetylmuramate dehydrogenase
VRVLRNVPLAPLTTLRLGGPARRLVSPDDEREVVEAVTAADDDGEPLLVLGGGSNLVVSDAGFPGTVLRMGHRGVALERATDGGRVLVTATAGEPWDELVGRCVAEGLAGVECLSGIPGLVGAVPMQNVGAYGQDVGETIVRVRAWERASRRIVEIDREACRFAYRSSAFRGRDGHVILSVTFALVPSPDGGSVRYAELARALGLGAGERAPLARIREAVVALRRTKGMVVDERDRDTHSAGSFFTNPILTASELEALRARVAPLLGVGESMPVFPEPDGRAKVSAAWLIERAGFARGHAMGPVAISHKHALALTHRGGGTTRELLLLARAIREEVAARLGVTLENEPVLVGVAL